jgi:L-cysteate sulfo-lyase
MASVTDKLPRVRLAHLPTPIDALPHLSRVLGGPELFVKRDDQTGLATGGNKVRKLEFLIAEALENGADTVITAGSTQSNHARQTAAAAARSGLACHLVLYAPDGKAPTAINGNILLDYLLGAVIHWTTERAPYDETIAQVEAQIKADGGQPHVIPYGGSNATGLMGYVAAMEELAAQVKASGPFDVLVFATSSGGTQAGMILGAKIAGLAGKTRLLGISVDRPKDELAPHVTALAVQGARLLGIERDEADIAAAVEIDDAYLGGGYAVIGDVEREAVSLLARHEGILADPVYTGRALGGLIDLIRRGAFGGEERVLFLHTGGSASLFAFTDELGLG